MRIELSDPDVVDDLVERLRALKCRAARVGATEVDVTLPWSAEDEPWSHPRQAEAELRFLVGVWQLDHPDVEFRVIP